MASCISAGTIANVQFSAYSRPYFKQKVNSVLERGLEPPRVAPPAPKAGAYTISPLQRFTDNT